MAAVVAVGRGTVAVGAASVGDTGAGVVGATVGAMVGKSVNVGGIDVGGGRAIRVPGVFNGAVALATLVVAAGDIKKEDCERIASPAIRQRIRKIAATPTMGKARRRRLWVTSLIWEEIRVVALGIAT